MKIRNSIFILFAIFLVSCKKEIIKPKIEYNQKANQLIQQLISEENCGCILEIPKESLIEIQKLENPNSNFEKIYIRKLSLQNRNELDSLDKLSKNFKFEEKYLKKNNIKLIKRSSIRELEKGVTFFSKTCRNSFKYFIKPIFNKEFNKAIINYGSVGLHGELGMKFFEYKNNKWMIKNGS
ncbi:hypothetical protein [Flavobacterium sp.]|uniref:hypothetical protein n=1 Tax=Flavobacterium sp. TaxID=239 RepID=UPI003262E8D5